MYCHVLTCIDNIWCVILFSTKLKRFWTSNQFPETALSFPSGHTRKTECNFPTGLNGHHRPSRHNYYNGPNGHNGRNGPNGPNRHNRPYDIFFGFPEKLIKPSYERYRRWYRLSTSSNHHLDTDKRPPCTHLALTPQPQDVYTVGVHLSEGEGDMCTQWASI